MLSHYGSDKETRSGEKISATVNPDQCCLEWNFVKELVLRELYLVGQNADLWKLLSTYHSKELPNLIKLAQIGLPTNTAGSERGFSAQNRIKNSTRNRLKPKRLDYLMTINIEGPPSKEFDFTLAFDELAKQNRKILK